MLEAEVVVLGAGALHRREVAEVPTDAALPGEAVAVVLRRVFPLWGRQVARRLAVRRLPLDQPAVGLIPL